MGDPIAMLVQYGWVLTVIFPMLLSFYFGLKGKPFKYIFIPVLVSLSLSVILNFVIALASPMGQFLAVLGVGVTLFSILFPVAGAFLSIAVLIAFVLTVLLYLLVFGIAYLIGMVVGRK